MPEEPNSKIEGIRNSGDYMLIHALEAGSNCDWHYHPSTPRQKQAFTLGLSKWLTNVSLHGISPFELSDPLILKGFVYKLITQGRLAFQGSSGYSSSDQCKIIEQEIKTHLEQYNSLGRLGQEIREEKAKFEKGLQLGVDYISGYGFYNFVAGCLYGIDTSKISDRKRARLSQIHRDISRIISLEIGQEKETYLPHITELYGTKIDQLHQSLLEGDLKTALETCDCLELLLRFLEYGCTNPEIQKANGTAEDKHEPSFELNKQLEALKVRKKDIARRMENPIYDLEQRMDTLAEEERYEEAAGVRDQLKRLKEEYE